MFELEPPVEWWALAQATLVRRGQSRVLTLLTEPYHGDPAAPAWAIGMTPVLPANRLEAGMVSLSLGQGWEPRLPAFLKALDLPDSPA